MNMKNSSYKLAQKQFTTQKGMLQKTATPKSAEINELCNVYLFSRNITSLHQILQNVITIQTWQHA